MFPTLHKNPRRTSSPRQRHLFNSRVPFFAIYACLALCLASAAETSRSRAIRKRSQPSPTLKCAGVNPSPEMGETIPPANMTERNITIAFLLNMANQGDGRFFGGAFLIALEDLQEIARNRSVPVRFNWVFKDTLNSEPTAVRQVLDTYYLNNINVSAFIGPNVYCRSVGSVVTALARPLITFDCHDSENDGHHLMVNTETRFYYVSQSILSVMLHFKWRSFWLISGQRETWAIIVKRLKDQLDATNITINDEDIEDHNDEFMPTISESAYDKIIDKSMKRTRVYLFLGNAASFKYFTRKLHAKAGEEMAQYAVIAVDDGRTDYLYNDNFYMTKAERSINLSDAQRLVYTQAFKNVLIITQAKRNINNKEFEKKVLAKNNEHPIYAYKYELNTSDLLLLSQLQISNKYVARQAYQLYDATMIYGRAIMSLMATPGKDPENAYDVIGRLRCHEHESIQKEKFWIHENGQSESSFQVASLTTDETGHMKIKVTGKFNKTDTESIPIYMPVTDVEWISGHVPESDPECGFEGDYCPTETDDDNTIAVAVAVPISVFLIVVVTLFFGIRHCVYEKKLDRLAWKIERDEIQFLNEGQFRELTTPSRNRKKNSLNGSHYNYLMLKTDSQSDITHGPNVSEFLNIGYYRGAYVAVKELTRKHVELTRVLKKQMQLRKELTHENINRFIGACFEPPKIYIVTQYCPRKSLQDILRNEYAHLDDMFITSLVQDLIRGMTFIHESQFGYHGNLKSSNCLVDSRWTLKISDFGFSALGPPPCINFDDDKSFEALLWTAPELLRKRRSSSTASSQQNHHHHHHNMLHSTSSSSNMSASYNYSKSHHYYNNSNYSKSHHQIADSQKGDVYSFAIILYELYGRAGPWGQVKMTPKEIIETLIQPTTTRTRPDTSDLTCDNNIINLIKDCWQQDHNHRPDFKGGIRAQFKPIQQGYLKSNIFDNMLAMMEKYANNLEAIVAERTEQLKQEKKMTDNLLLRMLPRSVAEKLKRGHRVEPEQYEQVSIYFSDIVGFTQLSANSTPMEVVDLLNDLYTCFDSIIEEFDVYKVETIGDAYMVVSGLPIRNGDRHAGEIASMALELLGAIKQKKFKIQGSTNHMLKIRIGIHSGPCCAGVVGLKMPRYCLFGDTVNTANRMESTGEALKIHCSSDCKKILDKLGGYTVEERGYTEMKGKGRLLTYFLLSEDIKHRHKRISQYKKMGGNVRCVSSSNLDYTSKIFSGRYSRFQFPRQPGNNRDSSGTDRGSWTSSLNTSVDSTWSSEVPERPSQLYQFNPPAQAPSPHDFIASTLPRASGPKYNIYMSPIAEDPPTIGEMSTLEKTTSFPNSSFMDCYPSSETDPLLVSPKAWACSLPTNIFQPQPGGQSLNDRCMSYQTVLQSRQCNSESDRDGRGIRPDGACEMDSQTRPGVIFWRQHSECSTQGDAPVEDAIATNENASPRVSEVIPQPDVEALTTGPPPDSLLQTNFDLDSIIAPESVI